MTYANATALTVKQAAIGGTAIGTLQSPDGTNGNKFHNDGKTVLRVKNAGGSPINVTVETPGEVGGDAIADRVVSVPATTGDSLIGPFPAHYNQPGSSEVFVSFSSVTSVTVDVYRV